MTTAERCHPVSWRSANQVFAERRVKNVSGRNWNGRLARCLAMRVYDCNGLPPGADVD
jgi:hypothetical protein